ncbi:MAG TPA: Rv2578c family radical SAM protein [Streptosporangiaceae bacterium]|nr:Rv2578c family radical SAM protein [Streptosporangiaceae bacterium]
MRWDHLRLDDQLAADQQAVGGDTLFPSARRDVALPLIERGAVARTFDTPGFRGMTFFEVQAKSVVNRVPEASRMPFRWTINPYRGCQHACAYCFARNSHTYLDLDAGADFDTKVVVKVNAPELVRKKLASPGWQGEHIAMGTNVDCYQRAEGRYRLMPGIIGALKDAANPFSILTKGTLILRDIDLLAEAAQVADVGLNVSVGSVDTELWRSVEPGTPAPGRRLEACATLNERGLCCGVLMGPVIPFLSDSPAQLEAAVSQIAAAGATQVTPIVLHLRPGIRDWFFGWLRAHHPGLVGRYLDLYGRSAYAPKAYQARISGQVRELADTYAIGRPRPGSGHGRRPVAVIPAPGRTRGPEATESMAHEPHLLSPAEPEQLTLL